MTAKVKMGTGTAALKNRAMFIVAFMIALLSVLFYYIMVTTNEREIGNIAGIYDGLLDKYYAITQKYVIMSHRTSLDRLMSGPGVMDAVAARDRDQISRLTRDFMENRKRTARHFYLREINWYFGAQMEEIKVFSTKGFSRNPASVNPLVKDVLSGGGEYKGFFVGRDGMTYRVIAPVKSSSVTGALEIVVNPGEFVSGVYEMLGLEAVIVLQAEESVSKALRAAANPDWREIADGYFIKTMEKPYEWLTGVTADCFKSAPTFREARVSGKTYLLHCSIRIDDYRGKPAALLLAARDITMLRQAKDGSFFRLIIYAGIVLVVVFIILYYSFGRLVRRLVARDLQLEAVNKELEAEIGERSVVEDELKVHREHLEEMIAEGTMELEIKSQEIQANEMKLRIVTSNIRDAILMTGKEGHILFWNEAALRVFGYGADELRIKNFFTHIVPTSDYEGFIKSFGDSMRNDDKEPYGKVIEFELKRKNGQEFPVEMMVSEVEIQGETNVIVLFRDVTLKKQEETQKRFLLRAVEQSSVAIQISDTDGIIQYVNPMFTQITGYKKDEVIGRHTSILKSDFNPEEDYRNLWETITAGKDWHGELYNRKKNGDLYWDATLISPIKDFHGNITHFVAIKEDITERKNMEVELLTAKENAEAASRAKGEFLANMSHEIRTPMNAIMGMTELALGTDLNTEQREYLEIVSQASGSLLKLLNDILDFSKVEAGKLILELKPFDIRKVLADTVKTLAVQAHKKNLELVYFIDSLVPERLNGDAGRLRQVVVNLIGNAIKFTDEGEIVLKIDILEDGIDNKVLLHFVISDTGIGIQEDQLNYIFEQFSQVDASSTRKYGGTGLGLAISGKLVELMGGVIWAESPATFAHSLPAGPGSTFHFTGLFELCAETSETLMREAYRQLKGLPLLLVDDNETNLRFLSELLARYGLMPDSATSGQEALDVLSRQPDQFQILILDYRMPGMDGGALLNKIREDLHIEVPVIFLTSGAGADELLFFKSLPVASYLFKPVNPQDLLNNMLELLGFEPVLSPGEVKETPAPGGKEKMAQLHILVAEDNAINQRLIKRLLEKEGHRVTMASDGKDAVDAFTRNIKGGGTPFDIILMDIQMPSMDGVEATGYIRKLDKDIPIIALTAHAMKGDKGKFLSQGLDDYVSKPIDRAFLFKTIHKYVSDKN
jgi:polar amino acid transport system substrate-binding protein